jgi:hypothetical protein
LDDVAAALIAPGRSTRWLSGRAILVIAEPLHLLDNSLSYRGDLHNKSTALEANR